MNFYRMFFMLSIIGFMVASIIQSTVGQSTGQDTTPNVPNDGPSNSNKTNDAFRPTNPGHSPGVGHKNSPPRGKGQG